MYVQRIKRTIGYAVALLVLPCSIVCNAYGAATETVLFGKLGDEGKVSTIHLKTIDGLSIPIDVAESGEFNAELLDLQAGFYVLMPIGELYLEPGYHLQINPDKGGAYRFQGKGSRENNLMRSTKKLAADYFPMGNNQLTYAAYQLDVPVFLEKLAAYKQGAKAMLKAASSENFRSKQSGEIYFYGQGLLRTYSLYYGTDSAKQRAFYRLVAEGRSDPNFQAKHDSAFKAMRVRVLTEAERKLLDSSIYEGWDMNDSTLFASSPSYRKAVSSKITKLEYSQYSDSLAAGMDQQLLQLLIVRDHIENDYIREYFQYSSSSNFLKMSKDEQAVRQVYEDFVNTVRNKHYLADVEEIYAKLKSFSDGSPAPDFEYESVGGEKVKLSSLRGKYVYIDVWATWCGPCKAEIPYLAKLEADFGDRKITFLSLSVDRPADKEKWRNFVLDKQLKGIQVITENAFESDFVQKFNINAIPRFILIDPQGKIVAANANRPSDPELRKQFETLL